MYVEFASQTFVKNKKIFRRITVDSEEEFNEHIDSCKEKTTKSSTCPKCKKAFSNHDEVMKHISLCEASEESLKIANYLSSRNLSYRTTITFTAGTVDAPEGSSIHWFINGKDSGVTGEKYKAEGVKDDFTVQAKLIGRDGSILSESEKETVTVSNGFFARLIALIRSLFGNLPVIAQ